MWGVNNYFDWNLKTTAYDLENIYVVNMHLKKNYEMLKNSRSVDIMPLFHEEIAFI